MLVLPAEYHANTFENAFRTGTGENLAGGDLGFEASALDSAVLASWAGGAGAGQEICAGFRHVGRVHGHDALGGQLRSQGVVDLVRLCWCTHCPVPVSLLSAYECAALPTELFRH